MTTAPCTKIQLIEAVNSFGKAMQVQDPKLMQFAAKELNDLMDTLEFTPQPEAPADDEE